jgi:hypothetical protein
MPNDDPTIEQTAAPAPAPQAPAAQQQQPLVAPVDTSGVERALESVGAAIGAINSRLNNIEDSVAPRPPQRDLNAEADSVIQQFTEDPGGTIDSRAAAAAEKVILEKMGPGMSRDLQNRRELFLDREASRVDGKFGTGFFEETIRPLLVTNDRNSPGRLESLNIWLQADPEAIRGVIDGVVGQHFMDDTTHGDLMTRISKARTERENAQAAPNLMGPGIAASPAQLAEGRLSPEHRGQVERIQEAGFDFNEDTVRTMKAAGKTLSGYLAATGAAAKKGAA